MYKYHGSSQLGSKRSGSNHPCLKKRSEELREGRGEQLVSKIRLEGGREWKRLACPMRSADLTTHTIMAPLEREHLLGGGIDNPSGKERGVQAWKWVGQNWSNEGASEG